MAHKRKAGELFEELVSIVAQLRDPKSGCPWDLQQTHQSLKPYLIEECYEAVDAIKNAPDKLHEELGDVLLQVVLHAQLAKEAGDFEISRVIECISNKLINRHPHVFADTKVKGTDDVLRNWEEIKRQENKPDVGMLESIPKSLPALHRAQRIGEKVARVGFDWDTPEEVASKVSEEVNEFLESSRQGAQERLHCEEEFGDLLFTVVQLARKMGFNAEDLLNRANSKFSRRFGEMERLAGRPLKDLARDDLEKLWQEVKISSGGLKVT